MYIYYLELNIILYFLSIEWVDSSNIDVINISHKTISKKEILMSMIEITQNLNAYINVTDYTYRLH